MSISRWHVHHDHKGFLHVHSTQNAPPSKVLEYYWSSVYNYDYNRNKSLVQPPPYSDTSCAVVSLASTSLLWSD